MNEKKKLEEKTKKKMLVKMSKKCRLLANFCQNGGNVHYSGFLVVFLQYFLFLFFSFNSWITMIIML